MMSTPIESGAWCRGVLTGIGLGPTATNRRKTRRRVTAMLAWKRAENGARPCNGVPGEGPAFNGFATTERMPGSTDYNSVPVQNYLDAQQGVDATVKTLENGRYQGILDALAGANSADICAAIADSQWG